MVKAILLYRQCVPVSVLYQNLNIGLVDRVRVTRDLYELDLTERRPATHIEAVLRAGVLVESDSE